MSRVRRLNISTQTGGFIRFVQPTTAAWDLETDLEPRFAKRSKVPLLPMSSYIPTALPKIVPVGWSVVSDPRFIKRRIVPSMQSVALTLLPYLILTTNAAAAGGTTLSFAAVPVGLLVAPVNGMVVYDLTTAGVIPADTKVIGKTATTVTISAAITGTVGLGDRIYFTY